MAGIGIGGSVALGGSFAVGDAVAQGLGIAVGLQDRYSLSQTILAGGTGFLLGGYAGYRDPGLLVFSSGFRYLTLPQVARSRLGHEAALNDFRTQAARNGFIVRGRGEVSVRTPGGRLRKFDTALQNPSTRTVSGIEIKSTPGAMTRNDAAARHQFAMDAWVNRYGAQVVGANSRIGTIHTTARVFWPAPPDLVNAGWWGYTALGSMGSITKREDQ